MSYLQGSMTQMQGAMSRMMDSIALLARIANDHENRLGALENPTG